MTAEEIAREHQRDLQQLRDFRLMDDDFMTKVFENRPQEMQLVLRIILQMPDLEVVEVRTQVFVENLLKRSVQLDVVATDHGGRMFNVEIQRADEGADPRRARYHSSMMDAHLLARKGTKFYELPEAWVIFITENDIMEEGCPLYQVERRVQGSGRDFHDGSHIVYVNGAYRGLGKADARLFLRGPGRDVLHDPGGADTIFQREQGGDGDYVPGNGGAVRRIPEKRHCAGRTGREGAADARDCPPYGPHGKVRSRRDCGPVRPLPRRGTASAGGGKRRVTAHNRKSAGGL